MKQKMKVIALAVGALMMVSGGTALAANGERTRDRAPLTADCIGPHAIDALAIASDYLGLTEDEIQARRVAGESLAEIAVAEGKTAEGLVAALVDAHAVRLQALVDDGTITEEQRDLRLVRIEARMWTMVERHVGTGGGGHHGGGGPGGPH